MELNTDLSEKSIKNYGGGVRKIAKDLIEQDLTHQNLFEITSADDLKKFQDNYLS